MLLIMGGIMKKLIVNNNYEFEKIGLSEEDDVMAYNNINDDVVLINSSTYRIINLINQFNYLNLVLLELEKEYDISEKNRDIIAKDVEDIISELIKIGILKYE